MQLAGVDQGSIHIEDDGVTVFQHVIDIIHSITTLRVVYTGLVRMRLSAFDTCLGHGAGQVDAKTCRDTDTGRFSVSWRSHPLIGVPNIQVIQQ